MGWLVVYCFKSRSRIFHLYEDVFIACEGYFLFKICLCLQAKYLKFVKRCACHKILIYCIKHSWHISCTAPYLLIIWISENFIISFIGISRQGSWKMMQDINHVEKTIFVPNVAFIFSNIFFFPSILRLGTCNSNLYHSKFCTIEFTLAQLLNINLKSMFGSLHFIGQFSFSKCF
jgi:hypothetical protein